MKKPYFNLEQRHIMIYHSDSFTGSHLLLGLAWEKLKRELRKENSFIKAEYIIYKIGKINMLK